MDFKDRLRELRKESKLTTTELGAKIAKSDAAIRMWESGRTKSDVDTLIRIADFFDCSVDYLLGRSDIKNKSSWQELDSAESDLKKHLSAFSGRTGFMKSIIFLIESLGAINDAKTRATSLSLMKHLLNDCGELATKSIEIQHSLEVNLDAYDDFIELHEDCTDYLLTYRNTLRQSACTLNRKMTPFGAWRDWRKEKGD